MTQILQTLNIQNCIPEFIYKLYAILMMQKHNDIICWEKNTEVCIKDSKRIQLVLGTYFRHTRLDSFIRQLNMYGFNKVVKLGRKKEMCFFNPYFRKGNIDGMIQIKRKKKTKENEMGQQNETERYKNFIQGNISILYDNVMELKNNNPSIAQDFNKIIEILKFITQRGTAATITQEVKQERDFMLDRDSICSIEREFAKN